LKATLPKKKCGGLGLSGIHSNKVAIEKIKILGAILKLPTKQQCQSSPFTAKNAPNGLNWQLQFCW
jgi:hypothetical protein